MLEIVNDTGRWQSDAHAGPLGWILLNKMLTAAIHMNDGSFCHGFFKRMMPRHFIWFGWKVLIPHKKGEEVFSK